MGLLDILNGMQNGPRGSSQSGGGSSGGGMSPLTMALVGLLAYKALKHVGGSQPATPAGAGQPASPPSGGAVAGGGLGGLLGGLFGGAQTRATPASAPGGGLSDLIPGGLGGLLGGAAAGGVLSGGLGTLIKELQDNGHGQTAQSWVDKGPNREIAPNDLASALGADTIDKLAQHTGMDRGELLAGLSRQLPDLINHLTPDGRLPTSEEASKMV